MIATNKNSFTKKQNTYSEPEANRKSFQWVIFTYRGREYYELFIWGEVIFTPF